MVDAERLREAARALYGAHERALGLKPWSPGGWRLDAPSTKQREALVRAAGSGLVELPDDEQRAVVRAVAAYPDAAGRGAVHDCLAVVVPLYQRGKAAGAEASRVTAGSPWAALAGPVDADPCRDDAGRRLAVVRAVLGADGPTLARLEAVVGR